MQTTRHCRTVVKGRTDDDDPDGHAVSLNCVATRSFPNLHFFSVSCVSTAQYVMCVGYSAGKGNTHSQANKVYYFDFKISALDIFALTIIMKPMQYYPPSHTCIFSSSYFNMNLERVCHFLHSCYIYFQSHSPLLKRPKNRRKV
jgi:hypothetical protein